jgi:hypothetical protein
MDDEELRAKRHDALSTVLGVIPRNIRLALKHDIKFLQEQLEVGGDLTKDLRGGHWAVKREEKVKSGEDLRGKHWAKKREEKKVLVATRGQGSDYMLLKDAAEYVGKTEDGLLKALNRGRGTASFSIVDNNIEYPVSISRVNGEIKPIDFLKD